MVIILKRNEYLQDFLDQQKIEGFELQVKEVTATSQWLMPGVTLLSQDIENDAYSHAKEMINKMLNEFNISGCFYVLEVESKDDSCFEGHLKNDTIGIIESIQNEYDAFILNKICRKDATVNECKKSVRVIKKQRIGREERSVLYAQFKFASSYYREDEIKKKELFILKRYMDEMEHMGNTDNIDQIKLDRFNELIKEGEQLKK